MNLNDQLNFASTDDTQQAAFTLLDLIQGIEPKGIQLTAVAFMFVLMCQRYRQDPREVLYHAHKRLNESLSIGRGEYTRAIQNYLKEEL